ncbi:hypothetical protein DIPPA_19929 [Diplonema papillatum]|nr:hypothetical protein DIPPA_19929 [Diplonema papillatum]
MSFNAADHLYHFAATGSFARERLDFAVRADPATDPPPALLIDTSSFSQAIAVFGLTSRSFAADAEPALGSGRAAGGGGRFLPDGARFSLFAADAPPSDEFRASLPPPPEPRLDPGAAAAAASGGFVELRPDALLGLREPALPSASPLSGGGRAAACLGDAGGEPRTGLSPGGFRASLPPPPEPRLDPGAAAAAAAASGGFVELRPDALLGLREPALPSASPLSGGGRAAACLGDAGGEPGGFDFELAADPGPGGRGADGPQSLCLMMGRGWEGSDAMLAARERGAAGGTSDLTSALTGSSRGACRGVPVSAGCRIVADATEPSSNELTRVPSSDAGGRLFGAAAAPRREPADLRSTSSFSQAIAVFSFANRVRRDAAEAWSSFAAGDLRDPTELTGTSSLSQAMAVFRFASRLRCDTAEARSLSTSALCRRAGEPTALSRISSLSQAIAVLSFRRRDRCVPTEPASSPPRQDPTELSGTSSLSQTTAVLPFRMRDRCEPTEAASMSRPGWLCLADPAAELSATSSFSSPMAVLRFNIRDRFDAAELRSTSSLSQAMAVFCFAMRAFWRPTSREILDATDPTSLTLRWWR